MRRQRATGMAGLLAFGIPLSPLLPAAAPAPEDGVETAFRRGAACLARDSRDDGRFADPYLSFVYPDEHLPSGAGTKPLTYRTVDADILLTQMSRLGPLPGDLARIARRAEAALRAAVPLWRGRGFSNTLKSPHPDGIALDTFCMAGWLFQDDGMARQVEEAIEGDRWLPPGWYDPPQAYRAAADEAWCLRLLEAAGRMNGPAAGVRARLAAELARSIQDNPAGDDAFYEAWHLGMLAADGDRFIDLDAIVTVFSAWAAAHERTGRARGEDILEWANIAASEALALRGDGRALRERALRILLERQGADGCWTIPGLNPPGLASSFLTLRALVALRSYRAAEAATIGPSGASPNPAPKIVRPAQ